jgi:diguanylate cyclase (GGDEF)-like protein
LSLDVRTLVVVLLVSALLMSATLLLDLRSGRAPGLGRWNLGLMLLAAGWLLIVSRGALPGWAGVALADALLLAGLCSQYAAVLAFGGRPVPAWLVPGPPGLMFVLLLPLLDDYAGLTLAVTLAYAAGFAALAGVMMRLGEAAGPVRWLTAGTLLVAGGALLARAADIWLYPEQTPEVFTASPLHGIAFIVLVAATVSSSFGFLVMQRRCSEAEARRLAMYDPLTGSYNRRAFVELAERQLARARRDGAPAALLAIDLDHFKQVNDRYGHAAGDRVLADFAARLRHAMRAGDLPARIGGEEFCVLLAGASLGEACAAAERLRAAVESPPLGELPAPTTVSIGVAASPGCGSTLDGLLRRADERLYQAKREGRNRVAAPARLAHAA